MGLTRAVGGGEDATAPDGGVCVSCHVSPVVVRPECDRCNHISADECKLSCNLAITCKAMAATAVRRLIWSPDLTDEDWSTLAGLHEITNTRSSRIRGWRLPGAYVVGFGSGHSWTLPYADQPAGGHRLPAVVAVCMGRLARRELANMRFFFVTPLPVGRGSLCVWWPVRSSAARSYVRSPIAGM
jgi:hypothetical protein